jgi:uncharacterized Zn-binding protein involved in type VI secretion
MGAPAAVLGDKVQATCAHHLIPNPASGIPQPGPPMPHSSPLTMSLCTTVLVGGSPAAVAGSQGLNTPPHVGLHPADPFFAPPTETAVVVQGSTSVLLGGMPAARSGDSATACGMPGGTVLGTASTVLIGG